ncbi:hypothetical protein Tco_1455922 [Tanacetum coccineum]
MFPQGMEKKDLLTWNGDPKLVPQGISCTNNRDQRTSPLLSLFGALTFSLWFLMQCSLLCLVKSRDVVRDQSHAGTGRGWLWAVTRPSELLGLSALLEIVLDLCVVFFIFRCASTDRGGSYFVNDRDHSFLLILTVRWGACIRILILAFRVNHLEVVTSILTQRELDRLSPTYNILANMHPEFLGHDDTIQNSPTGKIGIYTCFIEFSNFRIPLSKFFLCVLQYYHINFSQLSVLVTAKVSHFEIMCRVLGHQPSLGTFRRFYCNSISNGWLSFSKRGPTPCCSSKPLDSLKN